MYDDQLIISKNASLPLTFVAKMPTVHKDGSCGISFSSANSTRYASRGCVGEIFEERMMWRRADPSSAEEFGCMVKKTRVDDIREYVCRWGYSRSVSVN